jgi:hypothetical protein
MCTRARACVCMCVRVCVCACVFACVYVYASASACACAWQPEDDSGSSDSRASGGVVCNAHVHALHQGKHHRYFTTYSIAIAVLPTASTAGPTALPRAAAPTASTAGPTALPRAAAPTAPPPSSSTLALGASCADAATSAIGDRSIKRRIATAHSRGTWSSLRSGILVDTVRSVNLKRKKTRKKTRKKKRSKKDRK